MQRFFFFQAEDGIRDLTVTGVQTCALPIFDDVYIGSAVGARMDLRDINNVQVLRGPQGTLFGRNTIGGAILMSTADPGDKFGGAVRGGFGSDKLFDGFLALNAPLSDALKARFTAGRRKQDGYVTRTDGTDLGDTNTYTLTSKFIWKPTEKLEARWLADYSHADEHGSPLVFASIDRKSTFPRVASSAASGDVVNGTFPTLPAGPHNSGDPCAHKFQNPRPLSKQGQTPPAHQPRGVGSLHQLR